MGITAITRRSRDELSGRMCSDDAVAFANREDLVGLHFFESFKFLSCGPFHFNCIDDLVCA